MRTKVVYPPHIWNIREIQANVTAGDLAGQLFEDHIQEVDDNLTILKSRESGIARREKILGIIPKTTDTLEERRLRVHLRWYNQEMYTEKSLQEKLDGALGAGNYEFTIYLEEKLIELKVSAGSETAYSSVKQLLEEVVPLDYLISVFMFSSIWSDLYYGIATVMRTTVPIYDNGLEVR